jgi:hypothetical protein
MQPKREIDADEAAQQVVNAWGISMQTGHVHDLSEDSKDLAEAAFAYRTAKKIADNSRENDRLTDEQAEQERTARKVFMEVWRKLETQSQ